MADKEQKILEIVVDSSTAIAKIAELNKALDEQKQIESELRKELKQEGADRDALYKKIAETKEIQKQYSAEVRDLSKEIQNSINKTKEQEGSLKSLRAELSNTTKEYDSLSRAEREGAKGKELQDKINRITDELKEAEEATQRYQRNVGNYKKSYVEAFTAMGGATGNVINPLKNMKMGLEAVSKVPIIAILGLLVNIINAVIKALGSSEETMNSVTASLGIFKGAGVLVTRMLQTLGKGVAAVAEWLGKMADKLGLVNETMKTQAQLTKDQIALDLQRRQLLMDNSDAELESAILREKATDKLNYTAQERLEFLKQAVAIEEDISKRNLEAAQEQYRILAEQSKLADNSKEENDALAQAYADMNRAQIDYLNKKKELNAQIIEATNQIKTEEAAAAAARKKQHEDEQKAAEEELRQKEELKKMADEELEHRLDIAQREIEARLALVKDGTAEELELQKQALKAKLDLDVKRLESEEGTGELIKLARAKYEADLSQLDADYALAQLDEQKKRHDQEVAEMLQYYQNKVDAAVEGSRAQLEAEIELNRQRMEALEQAEGEGDEAFYARRLAAEKAYIDSKKRLAEYEVEIERTKTDAIVSITGSMATLLESVSEQNESLAKASKVLALAQIAIETGVATARGISSAMAVPFPANLAAIATTIATITAGIVSAIQTVNSAKFAKGGRVTGPGSGTSDSISAKLSNGESVMTAQATSMFAPVLSSLNKAGGGRGIVSRPGEGSQGFEFMAKAFAAGMEMANLSVGVDEFTRVSDRVSRLKSLGSI